MKRYLARHWAHWHKLIGKDIYNCHFIKVQNYIHVHYFTWTSHYPHRRPDRNHPLLSTVGQRKLKILSRLPQGTNLADPGLRIQVSWLKNSFYCCPRLYCPGYYSPWLFWVGMGWLTERPRHKATVKTCIRAQLSQAKVTLNCTISLQMKSTDLISMEFQRTQGIFTDKSHQVRVGVNSSKGSSTREIASWRPPPPP